MGHHQTLRVDQKIMVSTASYLCALAVVASATLAVDCATVATTMQFKKAPSKFDAVFNTEQGAVVFTVHRKWAPNAADRFYHLLVSKQFVGTVFNRVVPGFVAEFGLSGDPVKDQKWQRIQSRSDPKVKSNTNATIAFATSAIGCVRPPRKGQACP